MQNHPVAATHSTDNDIYASMKLQCRDVAKCVTELV